MKRLALIACLFFVATPSDDCAARARLFGRARAASVSQFTAVVLSVHDGDTIHVRVDGKDQKIRLAWVDAPELTQPYGADAQKWLAKCARPGQTLTVRNPHWDAHYGRWVGEALIGGKSLNAGLVAAGFGWIDSRYTPQYEVRVLQPLLDAARKQKRGLWGAEKGPVAPWDWRRTH